MQSFRFFTIRAVCIGALAVIAIPAYSQPIPVRTEEVRVISRGLPVPLSQAGTSVSLLTADELDAYGNLFLPDILRQQAGISTSAAGANGQPATLRIRGEEGFRTLVLYDGVRLLDPAGPQIAPQLEHLISSGIGRVEILQGPQGLGYGSDAGGVVNITSLQDEGDFSANLDVRTGKFGSRQYSGNIGGGTEQVDYFLSVADFETDGFNTRASDNVLADDDGYSNTTFHGRLGFNLTEQFRLELVHRDVDGDSEFDGCFSGTTVHDCSSEYQLQASRAALNYDSEGFSHSLSWASTETDRENFALGVSSFVSQGELTRVEYVGSATALPGFDLVFGADWEEAENNGNGRNNVGVYAEYLTDFSDYVFFTAGLRHDDNDDFGTNTSYRITGAYLLDLSAGGTLKFKGSYGTGFRAPSPYEIEYNSGPFSYPPASEVILKQETSQGYEFGVEYLGSGDLHLEAVYFDQEVEDAIFFDLAAFSGYLQDIGTSDSSGVELSAEIPVSQALNFTANYTYNDTERPNGEPRRRRPEQLANFGLSWYGRENRWNLNAFYRMSRDSVDEVGGVLVPLDDFEVMDFSANFSVSDNIQLYGRLENAFDEEYQEVSDYNTAGRAAYVGMKLSF